MMEIVIWDGKLKRFYRLSTHVENLPSEFWLSNEGGEGMELKSQTLFEMIDQFFKENH